VYARATLLEIDTLRVDVDAALDVFRQEVLPGLQKEPGYCGVLVLSTPDGKGLLVSLWETRTAATAEAEHGFYAEVLERYMTLFRSPPDRERYEVVFAEIPALSVT
jgi:hypothetical protein